MISRIDAAGQAYAPAPSPVPYAPSAPYPSVATPFGPVTPVVAPPLVGVVLGTIVVAGLVYLLVRHPSGVLYRYPYYGFYRRAYYRSVYRPYYGPLRFAPAYRYGPYRWCAFDRVYGSWCR